MEEADKIYMQRAAKRLREALAEIRRVSKDDPDIVRAQREIEEATKYILRALNKEL